MNFPKGNEDMKKRTDRQELIRRGPTAIRRTVLVFMILWIGVIWGMSLFSGQASDQQSRRLVTLLRPLILSLGLEIDPVKLVRKLAHFSEYFILGLLARGAIRKGGWSFLPGIAVPVVDEEVIQRFVSQGRTGMWMDVVIDLAGFLCGQLIYLAVAGLAHLVRASGRRRDVSRP